MPSSKSLRHRTRAAIERFLSPGLGTCFRCHRPWLHPASRRRWERDGERKLYRFPRRGMHPVTLQLHRTRFGGIVGVEPHTTPYRQGRGCFPLCETCWAALSPRERVPFYRQLVNSWWAQSHDDDGRAEIGNDEPLIYESVLGGN